MTNWTAVGVVGSIAPTVGAGVLYLIWEVAELGGKVESLSPESAQALTRELEGALHDANERVGAWTLEANQRLDTVIEGASRRVEDTASEPQLQWCKLHERRFEEWYASGAQDIELVVAVESEVTPFLIGCHLRVLVRDSKGWVATVAGARNVHNTGPGDSFWCTVDGLTVPRNSDYSVVKSLGGDTILWQELRADCPGGDP